MYKVTGTVIYCLYGEYIWLHYLCLYQDKQSKLISSANNKIYDNIYGTGNPDVLTNII